MPDSISFRPITDDDRDFLQRVYSSTRQEEMAIVPWNEQEKRDFLKFQFTAQHTDYMKNYPDAKFQIILKDDEPIGRLYLERRDSEFRIIDIALLPEYRGQGIGGALMREILDEAAAANKPVTIHVEKNNPAMQLYDRLGFEQIEDVGAYWLMECKPVSLK